MSLVRRTSLLRFAALAPSRFVTAAVFVGAVALLPACADDPAPDPGAAPDGGAAVATCSDTVRNGDESDIDCGGTKCGACSPGRSCASGADCLSRTCLAGVCAVGDLPIEASCVDGVKNGTETDVDCGGTCAACGPGAQCAVPADCASAVCQNGACAKPTCTDGVKNGTESDVDCGVDCALCPIGKACNAGPDCQSATCAGNVCIVHPCSDGVKNNLETDVDCGGPTCGKCGVGSACLKNDDCASQSCSTTCTSASGFSGGTGTEVDPYLIYNALELDKVRDHYSASFKLMADISLAGKAFAPLGFAGQLDGNRKRIVGFVHKGGAAAAGLFGLLDESSTVKDLTLDGVDVESSGYYVGGLVGQAKGTVKNVRVSGTVKGGTYVGGIAGFASSNTGREIQDCTAAVTVTGTSNVGGLVGAAVFSSAVVRSVATGDVTGGDSVGGLVGTAQANRPTAYVVLDSRATGKVTGTSYVGGLVGQATEGGVIARSSATGAVGASGTCAGGLVGLTYSAVTNSFASGNVTGVDIVGGLVGHGSGLIAHSYSCGAVAGTAHVGGLVGDMALSTPHAHVADSFWDTQTSLQVSSAAGTGKTTADLADAATFAKWDQYRVWAVGGAGYPSHRASPAPCIVGASAFDGGSGTLASPYLIGKPSQLYHVGCNLSASYQLTADLDFAGQPMTPPIGTWAQPFDKLFAGTLDGNGKTISNWIYYGEATGLVGAATGGANVKNLTVQGFQVGGGSYVGTVVGIGATLDRVNAVGGVVRGMHVVGGLAGSTSGNVSRSSSSASVFAKVGVGGGLVGSAGAGSSLTDSYATGPVTGNLEIGSFIGSGGAAVLRCYGMGALSPAASGFGQTTGTVTSCYWNVTTTGVSASQVGVGKTDAEMKTQATFTGWDFTTVWQMGASGYPVLR